jgi:hypothetical protein
MILSLCRAVLLLRVGLLGAASLAEIYRLVLGIEVWGLLEACVTALVGR